MNLRSYYAEGSKTLAFEIVEQLGWETPDAVVLPDRLRRDVHQGLAGLRAVRAARADRRRAAALYGGQAEGCAPVASAFADERPRLAGAAELDRPSIAIGNPADGDLTIATARSSGGGIYAVPEDEIGPNIALLAERRASSARARRASRSAPSASRSRRRARQNGPRRRARHRHRAEDAGARSANAAADRDRRRRRRAARRAGGRRVTTAADPVLAELRERITAATASSSRSSTGGSRSSGSCTSTSANGTAAARRTARTGSGSSSRRRTKARCRTRASPSSSPSSST